MMSHIVLKNAEAALNVELDYRGDVSLLHQPRRTLLISRGERNPNPATPWIGATISAVEKLVGDGEVLVTGFGRLAYDLALWVCQKINGHAIVVLEHPPNVEHGLNQYLPTRHLLCWPRLPQMCRERKSLKKKERMLQRDLLMGWISDRAYAIHVRPSGQMAEIARLLQTRRCLVEGSATVQAAHGTKRPSEHNVSNFQSVAKDSANRRDAGAPGIQWGKSAGNTAYLTHFTREPDGAWPGEDRQDYLKWLCSGVSHAPRDSFAALCRILTEKRVRACGRLIGNSDPMVCLTACSPQEVVSLRRWRSGLMRWSFTSYGVAISKEVLLGLGAKPVLYTTLEIMRATPPGERRFMQLQHSKAGDWSLEEEWRIEGDIDLSLLNPSDMIAVVTTMSEVAFIRNAFGIDARIVNE